VNSLIVSVAIGLVFSFAVLAAITSVFTEAIARFLGLRGEYLLRGLRTMLDGDGDFALFHGWFWPFWAPKKIREADKQRKDAKTVKTDPDTAWVSKVMAHPLIKPSASHGKRVAKAGDRNLSSHERRQLPSYVSSRSFAQAIIDLAVPNAAGKTTFDDLQAAIKANVDSPVLRTSLLSLLKGTQDDIDAFRQEIERWYDDQMARVSGWYKRHVRWISLAIGLVLVLAFNVNAISISRALYSDEALRQAVVTEAAQASNCSSDEGAAACLQKIEQQVTKAQALGLPLGWTPTSRCATTENCSFWDAYGLADPDHNGAADVIFFLTVLAGYLLMVLSLVPGARFWFDLLGRLGSLRSTGPKPKPST
jgi:hypothetical protein